MKVSVGHFPECEVNQAYGKEVLKERAFYYVTRSGRIFCPRPRFGAMGLDFVRKARCGCPVTEKATNKFCSITSRPLPSLSFSKNFFNLRGGPGRDIFFGDDQRRRQSYDAFMRFFAEQSELHQPFAIRPRGHRELDAPTKRPRPRVSRMTGF